MLARGTAIFSVTAMLSAVLLAGCCKNNNSSNNEQELPLIETPPPTPIATDSVVQFSKVPLSVTLPAGWNQTQNTTQWLVYRPSNGGALVAMSGEKSCTLVNTRFASALRELGLTNVVWGTPQNTTIHGLRAKIAAGTAIEANQLSYVKYSLTYAAGGQGCLITLYNVWQSRADDFRATADQIILSVRPQ